ncbi:MAG: hypothetical protein GY856_46905, partial [bacterium]|nr:hypothetical protein [bacterium]
TAVDHAGNESAGVSYTGATLLPNPADPVAFSQDGRVHLSWNGVEPSGHVKQYNVYVSQAPFTSVEGMTPHQTVTAASAAIAGLTNDAEYFFAVATVNTSNGETKAVTSIPAAPGRRMIAHHAMDAVDQGLLPDALGAAHAVVQGDARIAAGQFAGALHLDGDGDWAGLDIFKGRILTGDDLSLSLWFKTDAAEQDDGENILFSANAADGSALFRLGTGNAGGLFHAVPGEAGETGAGFNDGQWRHLVLVQRGDGVFKLYVDNALVQSNAKTPVAWSDAAHYSIGQEWDADPSDFFTGQIDQLKIYNYVLTTSEILGLFTDNAPPELVSVEPADGSQSTTADRIVVTLFDRHGDVDDDAVIDSFGVTDGNGDRVAGPVVEENDAFTFTPVAGFPDGSYHLFFTARDMAGNTADHSLSFIVDNLPPARPAIT